MTTTRRRRSGGRRAATRRRMRGGQSDIWKEEIEGAFNNVTAAARALQFGRELLEESHTEFADAAANSAGYMGPEKIGFTSTIYGVYLEVKRDLNQNSERLGMAARDLAKAYPAKLKTQYNKYTEKPLGKATPLFKGPALA